MDKNTRASLVRYMQLCTKAESETSKLSEEEEAEKQKILETLDITHEEAVKSATSILGDQFERS